MGKRTSTDPRNELHITKKIRFNKKNYQAPGGRGDGEEKMDTKIKKIVQIIGSLTLIGLLGILGSILINLLFIGVLTRYWRAFQ